MGAHALMHAVQGGAWMGQLRAPRDWPRIRTAYPGEWACQVTTFSLIDLAWSSTASASTTAGPANGPRARARQRARPGCGPLLRGRRARVRGPVDASRTAPVRWAKHLDRGRPARRPRLQPAQRSPALDAGVPIVVGTEPPRPGTPPSSTSMVRRRCGRSAVGEAGLPPAAAWPPRPGRRRRCWAAPTSSGDRGREAGGPGDRGRRPTRRPAGVAKRSAGRSAMVWRETRRNGWPPMSQRFVRTRKAVDVVAFRSRR